MQLKAKLLINDLLSMRSILTIIWQSINTVAWVQFIIEGLPILLTVCTIFSTVCFSIYLLKGIKKRNLECEELKKQLKQNGET